MAQDQFSGPSGHPTSAIRSTTLNPLGASFAVLARVRAALTQELDPEQALEQIVAAIVPSFAVWCIVDPRTQSQNDLPVVTAHDDPRSDRVLAIAARALAHGERFVAGADRAYDEMQIVEGAFEGGSAAVGTPAGATTVVISAPLVSRGNLLGVISFGRREPAEGAHEVVAELASRVAVVVDLARSETLERRLRASRDDMMDVVVHRLRTPLSTFSMVTARLQRMGPVADAARAELDVLARTTSRLESILRDAVDCAHLESGRLRLQVRACSAVAIVRDAMTALRSAEPNRVIALELPATRDDSELLVFADVARVRQVVDCLLANAVRYGGDCEPISVSVTRNGGEVIVSIRDNGFGISPSRLERIFVPSWALAAEEREAVRSRAQTSLYVCRGLIEAQGGRIWVESKLGSGSTFSFSLPSTRDASSRDLSRVNFQS